MIRKVRFSAPSGLRHSASHSAGSMAAIARDFGGVSGIVAIRTTVFRSIRHGAVASRMGTFILSFRHRMFLHPIGCTSFATRWPRTCIRSTVRLTMN